MGWRLYKPLLAGASFAARAGFKRKKRAISATTRCDDFWHDKATVISEIGFRESVFWKSPGRSCEACYCESAHRVLLRCGQYAARQRSGGGRSEATPGG